MSSNEAWLALYFDAPLLSFGGECKFDRRETLSFPSRSAVTGLVAAALGVAHDDRPALARLAQLRLESVAFREKMGVLLEDYHTAGGGYPGNSADIPVSASRKSHPVVTQRHYFADGKFGAVLAGPSGFLEEIGQALRDPVWGGWIGRKHCIPTTPVFQGIFPAEQEALAKLQTLAEGSELRIYEECPLETSGAMLYPDLPVDFSSREFRPRAVEER